MYDIDQSAIALKPMTGDINNLHYVVTVAPVGVGVGGWIMF